jgi:hypothetical protein
VRRARLPSKLGEVVLQEISMDVQAREISRKHELLSRKSKVAKPSGHG